MALHLGKLRVFHKRTSESRVRRFLSNYHQFSPLKPVKLQPTPHKSIHYSTSSFHIWKRCLPISSSHSSFLSNTRSRLFMHNKWTYLKKEAAVWREASSALYAPPDGATVRVVDVDLDLENRLQYPRNLAENLAERNMDVNVFYLVRDYKVLKKLAAKKAELNQEKEDIAHQMAALVKDKKITAELAERKTQLISRGKEVRESLREIQKQYNTLEEKVMERALKLPAEIHSHTPRYDQIIMEVGDKPNLDFRVKSYTEIGQNNKWLSLNVPVSWGAYYLSGEYAELEQALISYISEEFLSADLQQLSCPDIFKTVVVEGCGEDFSNPDRVYTIMSKPSEIAAEKQKYREDSRGDNLSNTYHLTGLSLVSFAAYFTRMNISQKSLPMKYFAVGRHYTPDKSRSDLISPYLQTTRVELFAAATDIEQCEEIFEEYQALLLETYKQFNIRTRLVKMSRSALRRRESARVDVVVWAPSFSKYFKVAEVSMCGDYISRRLMIRCSPNVSDVQNTDYVHTIHGYALSVPDLMACIVENKQTRDGKFEWPECLLKYKLGETSTPV